MVGIKAVIFDWSGIVVDFGSRAPAEAFTDRGHDIKPADIDELHGIFDSRIEKAALCRSIKPEPTT